MNDAFKRFVHEVVRGSRLRNSFRRIAILVALVALNGTRGLAAENASPAPKPHPARLGAFSLRAHRIAFYSSRYIVGAEGSVEVRLSDGTEISGNTFFMDLRLNRFLIAGNVQLTRGSVSLEGAAFALYFDFDRAYFLPVGAEPDRWTYVDGDYAHPLRGRDMPGDTFYLPDVSTERIFLTATKAVVDPRQSVHFWPATINFGIAKVPFPGYFLLYSANPNFAQNALAPAQVDGPYDFLGGSHALSTLHLRYSTANKVFFALEQHQVSENHYIVASINPLTQEEKQYNLLAFVHPAPAIEISPALQENAFQSGFSQPLQATATVQPQINLALPRSGIQITPIWYYESLLAMPAPVNGEYYYGSPTHAWGPDHPININLTWLGYQNQIKHLPLFFRLRSALGYAHNEPTPLTTIGGVNYVTLYTHTLGITLLSPSVRVLRDQRGAAYDLQFNATLDKQIQWSSVPHNVDTTTLSLSLSKVIVPHVQALVQYVNLNVSDHYNTEQDQTDVYPSFTGVGVNNTLYPEYRAFRGFATTRGLTEQLLITPNPGLTFSASMREDDDFPIAVPQPQSQPQTGLPPYQANFDVRFKVNSILTIDVTRSYFFNWGGYYRWGSPYGVNGFNIQVVK
jgi:hypothetical protein